MNTNLSIRRSLSRYLLLLVSLLTLVGILSGCGASSTAVPSHSTRSTPTSTPPKELKGTISEFPLPTHNFYPGGLLAGPDGNLWFIDDPANHSQNNSRIGRITPMGKTSEFSMPNSLTVPGGITSGPDGKIWFTEMNSNKIGRLV